MTDRGDERPGLRPVRCLSFHSGYACRNSGVCCSSGWDIAVEQDVEAQLLPRLRASARLPNGPDGFRPMADPPKNSRSSLRRSGTTGSCWFRDDADHRCAIHREFGEAALPSACRHFPRVCVLEPAGVSLSLSHYCPTAVDLLFDETPGFSVVSAPRAFPDNWPFEGLDAREAYPPFLRPGVLLGFDGLRAFEEDAVRVLSTTDLWTSLATLDAAVEKVRSWNTAAGPLPAVIRKSFADSAGGGSTSASWTDPRSILRVSATEGIPATDLPGFRSAPAYVSRLADLPLRKYLAARLIAAWIMFQADDLRTVVRYLRLCLDTVLLFVAAVPPDLSEPNRWKEAIRNADLWLLHYSDPERLARNLR